MHETYQGVYSQSHAVKAHSDGTIEGYLVRFSGPGDPDLTGQYFTAKTWFGHKKGDGAQVMFHHGLPLHKDLKGYADLIFTNPVKVEEDEHGLFARVVADLRNRYEAAIHQQAMAGKIGWSSGSATHTARYAEDGRILRWPIVEATLSPIPAEPRNTVSAVYGQKSLEQFETDPALIGALKSVLSAETDTPSAKAGDLETGGATGADVSAPSAPVTEDGAAGPTTPDKGPVITRTENTIKMDTQTQQPEAQNTGTNPVAVYSEAQMKAIVGKALDAYHGNMKTTDHPGFSASNINTTTRRGEYTEDEALGHWYKTGDIGAVKEFIAGKADQSVTRNPRLHGSPIVAIKASNDTDYNITTDADGGYAVPTGHYNQIIAKMDEAVLDLGFTPIPGVGTTVNVTIDDEDDGEFVSTAEAAAFDRDAAALNQVAMTLVKYTKKKEMSVELLEDDGSNILAFIANFVARGMAKTRNNLIVTEATTNGTLLKTTASATALAFGEIEDAVYNDDLGDYLDDGGSNSWVMRRGTFGKIRQLVGSDRQYAGGVLPDLEGIPYTFSQKVAAYGTTTNKFALLGNWNYMGVRNGNTMEVLRDPYSKAGNGQVVFHYYFRTVYKVLQSEAIGWIAHA